MLRTWIKWWKWNLASVPKPQGQIRGSKSSWENPFCPVTSAAVILRAMTAEQCRWRWNIFEIPAPCHLPLACPDPACVSLFYKQGKWIFLFPTLLGIRCDVRRRRQSRLPLCTVLPGKELFGNIMSPQSIREALAARISGSVKRIAAAENGTQSGTERGRSEPLDRRVWRAGETKLSRLLVSWTRLVVWIRYKLRVHPCNFHVQWFKGLQVISQRI